MVMLVITRGYHNPGSRAPLEEVQKTPKLPQLDLLVAGFVNPG